MREIVGIFSHKELLEKLGIEKPNPDEDDILIREQVINSANRSKETQKTIDLFVNDLLLNTLFKRELGLELNQRTVYTGTILGMKDTRIYVLLDSPAIEIKVYCEDLEKVPGCRLEHFDNLLELKGISPESKSYKAGDIIGLRLLSCDDKGKWHFVPADIQLQGFKF